MLDRSGSGSGDDGLRSFDHGVGRSSRERMNGCLLDGSKLIEQRLGASSCSNCFRSC